MSAITVKRLVPLLLALTNVAPIQNAWAQKSRNSEFRPVVPKAWDDAAMASLEVPLANPIASPKQVSAGYYYSIPVRSIYKQYPVYAPGREPQGYLEWLKQQEPVVIWDSNGHFDSPLASGGLFAGFPQQDLYVREPDFYRKTGTAVAGDGTVPFYHYVIKKKGEVSVGILACAMCHTRVMPDGTILKGAQGSFPFDRVFACVFRRCE